MFKSNLILIIHQTILRLFSLLDFVRVFCSVHRVSPTSASRAVSSEAYLLFYERVADPSRLWSRTFSYCIYYVNEIKMCFSIKKLVWKFVTIVTCIFTIIVQENKTRSIGVFFQAFSQQLKCTYVSYLILNMCVPIFKFKFELISLFHVLIIMWHTGHVDQLFLFLCEEHKTICKLHLLDVV